MAEETAGQPTETSSESASDWSIESASAAFVEPVDDTTAIDKPQYAPTQPTAQDAHPAPAATTTDDDGEGDDDPLADAAESAAALAATATGTRDAKTGQFTKQSEKPSARQRKKSDRYRDMEWQVAQTARENADLKARLDAIERGTRPQPQAQPDAQPAARPAPKAQQPPVGPMPEPPNYRDYDTDEAFEQAKVKWTKDVEQWQKDRDAALLGTVGKGVEARFRQERANRVAEQADAALAGRLAKMRESKPDWQEKAKALDGLRSSWYDPRKHGLSPTPFLSDLTISHEAEGAELPYWLGSDVARAQVIADLVPTRPLRDALVTSPSLFPLLEHFATPEGVQEFEALKRMHPARMFQAIGSLSARLTAPSGSVTPAAQPVTSAQLPARPPGGTPGARTTAQPQAKQSFDDWMAEEDAKEMAKRKEMAGIR